MLDKSFKETCDGIKKDVKDTQLEIMINANTNLVNLYYRIGKALEKNSKWGNKFIDNVAFELKVGKFKPEFGSKMGFYLTALDEQVKDDNDNPSIGIILCSSKSNKIVDYTLKYINKPVGVSEHKIFNELPNNLLKDFPTEDELNMYMDIDEE